MEVPIEYMNKLANQVFFVSALLGGFSLSAIIMLIDNKDSSKLMINLFRLGTVATASFLVCIFSMTKMLMMTTEGYPVEVSYSDLATPRTIGLIAFIMGIISMMGLISLSGWTKSKSLGIFTTVLGIIATIFIILMF